MGVLMLMSKSRRRFPCIAGGCSAILAGGFILGLPYLNSNQPPGWIWFRVWLAALPSLLASVIAFGVLAYRTKATVSTVAFGVVAALANIQPAMDFWSGAVSGICRWLPHNQTNLETTFVAASGGSSALTMIP